MARITLDNILNIVKSSYDDIVEMLKKVNTKAVHINRTALDKLSEDAEGNPLYNGNAIGSGGISDVSSEANNAIVTKADGIWSKNYDADINSLNARSITGSELEIFEAYNNVGQTVAANGNIIYDTVLFTNGDLSINNGIVSGFKIGRIYEIQSGGIIFNSASRADTRIKNIRTGEYISNKSLSNSSGIGNSIDGTATGYLRCISDLDTICVEVVYANNTVTLAAGYPYIKITEVGRTYTEDPYTQAQEGVEHGIFTTTVSGAVAANAPITIDTIVTGNMSLNTANTGIHLTGGKTYRVSLIGGVIMTKIVAPKFLIYNLTTNLITNNVVSYNATVTGTADWATTGTGTYVSSDTDIDITIACDNAISKIKNVADSVFNILVEEIARPVNLQYTPNQATFSKTTLFEGNANTVASYILSDSVKNYDFIYILIRFFDNTNKNQGTIYIDTDDITTTDMNDAFVGSFAPYTRYLGFNFTNGYDKITINKILNITGSSVSITKIVGIKGSKTVDYSNLSDQQKSDLKSQLGITDVTIEEARPLITQSIESIWTP